MNTDSWNDRDVDALLSGKTPADGDLAALAPVVASLKATVARHEVASSEAEAFGTHLASIAAAAPAPVVARRSPWVRRVSLAGIGALALGAGVAGAAAADTAAPGDPLYSLDRALEHVGIGNGGFPERVDEATKLADEGETDQAVEHLAESLKSEGDSSSSQSLLDAAAQIRENGSAQSADVHDAVATMLEWMAANSLSDNPLTGKDFGQHVSEMAKAIGSGHSQAPTTSDAPGKSGDVHGKPDTTGKPDSVTTGKPDSVTTGTPDNPGAPDSVTTGSKPVPVPGLTEKPADTPDGKPDTVGKP